MISFFVCTHMMTNVSVTCVVLTKEAWSSWSLVM